MTSDKKTEAGRRNALKSTGPKTPEGKAAVRLNATKHGLLSRDVLLPGQDEAALKELGERLRDELQPVGELESLLMERLIGGVWRLRRLGRVEASIFAWELYGELAERAQQEARTYESNIFVDMPNPLDTITDERKHQEALSKQSPGDEGRARRGDRHAWLDLHPGCQESKWPSQSSPATRSR